MAYGKPEEELLANGVSGVEQVVDTRGEEPVNEPVDHNEPEAEEVPAESEVDESTEEAHTDESEAVEETTEE